MIVDLAGPNSSASISDVVIAAVGAMTMLSALVLSIFGYKITRDFSSIEARIAECERRIESESKDFQSIRALSTILARMLEELYVLADVSRRMIEDIGSGDNVAEELRRKAFTHRAEYSLSRLSRIGLYVALLDGSRAASFADMLDELVTKYSDRETISFLELIQNLLDEKERISLQSELPSLSVRVLGVRLHTLDGIDMNKSNLVWPVSLKNR